MWNTWSKRTKATVFVTKKTNSISTKRWKSSSTNICIPRRQPLRARPARERTHDHSNFTKWHRYLCRSDTHWKCVPRFADLSFDQRRRLVFGYSGVDAPTQFAVTYAVKEINQQTNSKPNKEADPRL